MRLPPPYTQTLFVDLIRFTPGQPDNVAPNGATISAPPAPTPRPAGPSNPPSLSLANGSSAHPRSMHPPPHAHSHPHHTHIHIRTRILIRIRTRIVTRTRTHVHIRQDLCLHRLRRMTPTTAMADTTAARRPPPATATAFRPRHRGQQQRRAGGAVQQPLQHLLDRADLLSHRSRSELLWPVSNGNIQTMLPRRTPHTCLMMIALRLLRLCGPPSGISSPSRLPSRPRLAIPACLPRSP